MLFASLRPACAFLLALLIAGCAGSGKTAMDSEPPPHPLAGDWMYSVDTPQGMYTGTVKFSTEGDSLVGAVVMDMAPEDEIPFGAVYDDETGQVSFSFDSGEFGVMDVELLLEDGALAGQQFVRDYSMHLDVTATRKEESASQ